ncbi:sulfatase [Algoriphagus sp. H41]|uniref:Sulfatase n=1 Tax=Algoriphagus oliviformis TaxID=2811231 RepID=A0ABS3C043_9BACT|nr:sulfatase [Algoriphagus oliviformis]MBN7810300.1 sulfatase [Algoriphagus oliviformis]
MKIKTSLFLLIFAILVCTNGSTLHAQDTGKPNVILVNVDDLGWRDVGFMGGSYYETPNLDRLASQSVVFTQAYAGASNCAPSRATMLTGRYPMTHGVYTVSPSDRGNAATRKLIPTPNSDHIPADSYTLAQLFKDQGYVTGIFGKWHVSRDPRDFGFDVNVGGGPQGNPGQKGYFSPYKVGIPSSGAGEYLTDRLTAEAISFAEENRDNPFFLYLPFYTVHSPLMAKEELKAKFDRKPGEPGRDNATYAAMIYSMDENVGRLMAAIDSLGLDENTILIFTSDNGGVRATSHQDPLRAGKGSYYEGGIRVPLFVRWPGRFQADRVGSPVLQMDFFPTIRQLLKAETELEVDGISILGLLDGEEPEPRELFWHFPIYLEAYDPREDQSRDPLFRTRPGSVIRSGDWKLHHYFEEDEYELYHLAEDLGERSNLLDSHPEKAQELIKKLDAWRRSTRAPVPTELNPSYDPAEVQRLSKRSMEGH